MHCCDAAAIRASDAAPMHRRDPSSIAQPANRDRPLGLTIRAKYATMPAVIRAYLDECSSMINRRRRAKRADQAESDPPASQAPDVQRALRLGWAVAETFGRLRIYQPEFANKRNDPSEMPRFSFSNSDLSGGQQLEVSYRRLVELAGALNLQPPDIPDLARLLSVQSEALDSGARKRIHEALENWSRNAWIQLNVRSAALGRAMTYGGSLADTYWYMAAPESEAFLSGRQSVDALLRPHRMRRMQERMSEVGDAFSAETCDAIGHSLGVWMLDERKLAWAKARDWSAITADVDAQPRRTPAQQLYFNLFRQVRTWRDLIFEARQPIDYISPGFRRRANVIAGLVTILLVIALALAIGLLIFLAFTLALSRLQLPASFQSWSTDQLIQAGSFFISVLSTLAIVTASLFSRASTAVQQFDTWLEQLILRRAIRKQTTVPWDEPPRRAEG
jgi:hypothetical protein